MSGAEVRSGSGSPEARPGAKGHWVPMASSELGHSGVVTAGAFEWNSAFIPYGNQLEANVGLMEKLTDRLKLVSRVEISPFQESRDNLYSQVDSVSPSGEATRAKMKGRSRKPTDPSLSYNYGSDTISLQVNFKGLAEQVAEHLPNGDNDRQFYPSYAKKVNQAVLSKVKRLPLYDLGAKDKIYPGLVYETATSTLLYFPAVTAAFGSLVHLATRPEYFTSSVSVVSAIAALSEAFTILHNLATMFTAAKSSISDPNNMLVTYGQYLIDSAARGRIQPGFFPERYFQQIIRPLIEAQFPGDDLIRVKATAVSSGK